MEPDEQISLFKEWKRLLEKDLEELKEDHTKVSNERLKIQQRFDARMKIYKRLLDTKDKYMKAIYEKLGIIDAQLKKIEETRNTQQKEQP